MLEEECRCRIGWRDHYASCERAPVVLNPAAPPGRRKLLSRPEFDCLPRGWRAFLGASQLARHSPAFSLPCDCMNVSAAATASSGAPLSRGMRAWVRRVGPLLLAGY